MTEKIKQVHVRRLGNDEIVKSLDVRYSYTSSNYDRVIAGLERSMSDDFYIDESEFQSEVK